MGTGIASSEIILRQVRKHGETNRTGSGWPLRKVCRNRVVHQHSRPQIRHWLG
jgi:hypothetical protein